MNNDRIWEMYYTDAYSAEMRQECRERIQWLAERVSGRVLDVGCSQGVLPILLGREGIEAVGVDIEEPAIDFAKARLAEEPADVASRVDFVVADVFSWTPPEVFDTVVLGEVLEHLSEPARFLAAVSKLMAPGGRLLVTVPLGWLEYHDHRQAFLPTDFIALLEQNYGIQELEIDSGKICVVASATEATQPDAIATERWVVALEQALLSLQYRNVDLTKKVQELRGERKELYDLRGSAKRLKSELERVKDRIAELEQREREGADKAAVKARTLESKLAIAQKQADTARKQLEGSIPHQVAELLVRVAKQPRKVPRLPGELISAVRAAAHVRRENAIEPAVRPLSRHVYEGTYRVDLPGAVPANEPVNNRILHLLEYTLPYQQNGYTLRSFQLIQAQRAHGFDPIVVTKPGFPEQMTEARPPETIAGAPHHRLPGKALDLKTPSLPNIVRTYVREASAIVRNTRPSVLQAASNFRNAYAALELGRNYGLPVVYEVRGLWEESGVANGRITREDRLYKNLVQVETYCMQEADAIVTLGTSLKDEIARRGVDPDKIYLVPNGVDLDAVDRRAPRDELREGLGLSGQFVVSYIGSISRYEMLHVLVEAMCRIRAVRSDIVALVVGDGDELANLEQLAAKNDVSDSIRFAGRVPHAEIPDYYALANAIVCTRGNDLVCRVVTPLKPYEAMAYRVPIIASDIPALGEIIVDGETGRLVSPEDPAALARAIIELADDPEQRTRLADNAHDWVRQHRSWSYVTAEYKAAYEHAKAAFAKRTRG